METWRLLAGVSVMLVLWLVLIVALGHRPGPVDVGFAIVFSAVGLVLGDRLSARLTGRDDD